MKAEGVCTPGTRSPEASGAPLPLRATWGCPAGPVPPSRRRRRRHAPAFLPRPLCPFQRQGEWPQNPPRGLPRPCCGPRGGGASAPSPSCWGTLEGGERSWGQRGKGKGRETKGMEGHGRAGVASSSKHPPCFGVPARGGGCVHPPLSPPNPRGTAPALHPPQGAPQRLLPGPEGGTPRPGGRPPPRSPLRSPGGAGGGAASIGRGAAASSARRSGAGRRRRRRREREGEGGRAPGCAASLEPSLAAAGAAAARG